MEVGLEVLVSAVTQLSSPGPLEQCLQSATDFSLDLLGADHASVRLCDEQAQLRSVARSGLGKHAPVPTFCRGQGIMGWAVQERRPVRVSYSPDDERFVPTPNRGFDVRSVMSVPLLCGDRVLGVFSVSAAHSGAFSEEHERAAVLLAHAIGQAVRCAELERIATTDALTRCYNHGYLLPSLRTEMNRAKRQGKPLSVLLMDLDHFKSVNDQHGHVVGDLVLRRFADAVRDTVRSFDVLIRRGGEEFELVMPGTSAAEGWRVAERIRERLHAAPLVQRSEVDAGEAGLFQNVSIGLATWDREESPERLDQRADAALYQAKRSGRDQTVMATPAGTSAGTTTQRGLPA